MGFFVNYRNIDVRPMNDHVRLQYVFIIIIYIDAHIIGDDNQSQYDIRKPGRLIYAFIQENSIFVVPLTISTSSNGIFISNLYLFASKLLTTLFGEVLQNVQ